VCGLYQSAKLLQEWRGRRDQAELSAPNSADNKGVVFTFLHLPPPAKATAIAAASTFVGNSVITTAS
jgi:hypothetical protein